MARRKSRNQKANEFELMGTGRIYSLRNYSEFSKFSEIYNFFTNLYCVYFIHYETQLQNFAV